MCHTDVGKGCWGNGSQEYEPLICDLWFRIDMRATERIMPYRFDFCGCDNGIGQN